MKKDTYLRKLEIVNTKVTDVEAVKVQRKARLELERFWRKAAIAWMEKNVWGKSFKDFQLGWQSADVVFTLNPGGAVKVNTFGHDFSFARGNTVKPLSTKVISKKELLR